ncbi:MAG TPA: nucleoside-diphosphate kinase [Flavobacteriales bacterium]|nr:nucleoside-diphosphate kinase [Flavobacteriales bacterium]HIA11349.1 nucleoside-diphosphate kinase [Flavobacteriales bacterium]
MAGDKTFTMVKPDAVLNQHTGAIIDLILQEGFKIKALKMTQLSVEQAKEFYAVHNDKPFFDSLISYMSSGPIFSIILEKENCVETFRDFIGATNPADAAEGTIRSLYGTSIEHNAVHGSDSDENATIESDFHFSAEERY